MVIMALVQAHEGMVASHYPHGHPCIPTIWGIQRSYAGLQAILSRTCRYLWGSLTTELFGQCR